MTSPLNYPPVNYAQVNYPARPSLPSGNFQQKPFNAFTRHVSPNPVPGKYEFYWEQLKENYLASRDKGEARYKNTMKNDRRTQIRVAALSLLAGLSFTAFRRLYRTVSFAFIMGLLAYPIMETNRTFPKMEEAYRQVQQGNPSLGKKTFRKGLDDSLYSIFHGFFKPLYYGIMLSMLLTVPKALKAPSGFIQNVQHEVLTGLGITSKSWPIRLINIVYEPLSNWGNRWSNRARLAMPWLGKLEA
jgi:hypothetical protein